MGGARGDQLTEQMFLIEARRVRRGDRPAGIARFIVIGSSRHAALSKLRVLYDTSDIDSLTTTPIAGVIPVSGALVHEMLRPLHETEASQTQEPSEAADDDEPWKRSA
jgi:hypothetical protein